MEFYSSPTRPFKELLLSFKAKRPEQGYFQIDIHVQTETLHRSSPYLIWGKGMQKSCPGTHELFSIVEDTLIMHETVIPKHVSVHIHAQSGANIQDVACVHIATRLQKPIFSFPNIDMDVDLQVPCISQKKLPHPRSSHLCSPTSITSLLQYLVGQNFNPIDIAQHVYDQEADIFGNWSLNCAEASSKLPEGSLCAVHFLDSFMPILENLKYGIPSIVSIQGSLSNAPQPYPSGHLVVVKGYNSQKSLIHCMDPACETDEETNISYDAEEFLQAWTRRGSIAYLIQTN